MKRLIFFIWILLTLVSVSHGGTYYVSDIVKITLRTGPGIDHRVLTMIQSGQEIELLTPGDEWSKVKLPDQKEGWVLSRFITSDQPNRLLLENLQKQYNDLLSKKTAPTGESTLITQENNRLKRQIEKEKKALKKLKTAYQELKNESSRFSTFKSDYQKLKTRLNQENMRAKQLEEALTDNDMYKNIWWFLSGAGVLLVGFLIGSSTSRRRKKSSLL